MRIDVFFRDRVGIAHDILSVLVRRGLNVVAMEVDPPHIFIDAQALPDSRYSELRSDLMNVPDVAAVDEIDLLPGARRRLNLHALLCAVADPVMAVDALGSIVVCNEALAKASRISEQALIGMPASQLLREASLSSELIQANFVTPMREVVLAGNPFLMEVAPILEGGVTAGGVLTLHTPRRLGGRMHAMQHLAEGGFESLIGESAPLKALKARAAKAAAADARLLIYGETGTGKELVAHACHAASARRSGAFLALNCAALPENLAESELFGYAPGAFSGANRSGKPGLLEMADRGSIFLDEIGEMSLYLQAKLLRFLNDGSFRRVGGNRELKADVRIFSATHRDLERMVEQGSFREDLFYRLNVVNLQVPPLRERGDDILLLARHFASRACTHAQRAPVRITSAACNVLLRHAWPGNVRELENVIFRAVTLSEGPLLDVGDLELAQGTSTEPVGGIGPVAHWDGAISAFERGLLQRLYAEYPSSRKLAARLQTSHTMMANKLRKYGISRG